MWHSIIKIHIALQLCMWKMAIIIFTFHICQDIVWCYIRYVLAIVISCILSARLSYLLVGLLNFPRNLFHSEKFPSKIE